MIGRTILAAGVLSVSTAALADVYSRAYGPKGVLFVDRPMLQWQVWAENGSELKKAWIKLGGETFAATYDAERKLASWTPAKPWSPGDYAIEMGVSTTDGMTVRKQWRFEVRKPPLQMEASRDSEDVVVEVNKFRKSLGLPNAYRQSELEMAAKAHAQYLIANSRTGHYQSESEPFFTGATPSDRLNAFGYVGGSSEVVHFGRASIPESVESLIAAPYHRFAFMLPGRVPMGCAYGSQRLVIDFGEGQGAETLFHPVDGQTGVPTTWNGRERPNPLRLHPDIISPPGYPIVFGRFSFSPYKLRMTTASLTERSTKSPVDIGINHPGNDDELTDAVILIPKKPLRPETEYLVEVDCVGENGERMRKSWKFRTGK